LLIFLQKPPFNIFIVHDLTHHASAKFDMMIQQAGEALAEQDTARAAARNASTIAKTATKTADTQAAAQAKKMAKKWKKPVGVSDPHQSSMTMPSRCRCREGHHKAPSQEGKEEGRQRCWKCVGGSLVAQKCRRRRKEAPSQEGKEEGCQQRWKCGGGSLVARKCPVKKAKKKAP
jgi:hypothetical protein